jgi:hypothetical protein
VLWYGSDEVGLPLGSSSSCASGNVETVVSVLPAETMSKLRCTLAMAPASGGLCPHQQARVWSSSHHLVVVVIADVFDHLLPLGTRWAVQCCQCCQCWAAWAVGILAESGNQHITNIQVQ